MKIAKKPTGRPSSYTETLALDICDRLSQGQTLISICAMPGMPSPSMVFRWKEKHESFRDMYTRAREQQAWHLFEEIIQIADDAPSKATGAVGTGEASARIAAERERINTRKFFISKVLPKIFGEKTTTELTGADGGAIKTESTQLALTDELKAELLKLNQATLEMQKPLGLE